MMEQIISGLYELGYLEHYGAIESRQARPNHFWNDVDNFCVRFVRPTGGEKWHCAVCGKKRGRQWFWTDLRPFYAYSMTAFSMVPSELLSPLTPVCADHPLGCWNAVEPKREGEDHG